MTGTPTDTTQARTRRPQAFKRAFHDLPEKRKLELSRIVAGITQTQGKLAAQWWLEGQLDAHCADPSDQQPFGAALNEIQLEGPGGHARSTDEAEDVTPNRAQLVATAPTTLAVLSPEERAYGGAVAAAEPFTRKQLEHVSLALTPQSRVVFEFVHLYACAHALSHKQSLKAHQISFFLPAETIHLATGVPTRTVYDALKRIKALGLVDYRGHVITLAGYGNRCDGTVFAVKLDALRTGAARVTFDDLKVSDYRNLEADIAAQRTVYRLAQSETWANHLRENLCSLLSWIQAKCTRPWHDAPKPRYLTMQASSKLGLEAVLSVTTGPAATRGQRIGAAAAAIAGAFGDQHSLPFWWRFCDALACLVERKGRDYSASVVTCMQREIAAKAEGFAHRPAALFISRLKRSGVYGEIMTT